MSRRSSAGIAAFALLIATWLVATLVPTNYVVYSPGPDGQPPRQGEGRRP
jgi:hypothetical protein